LSSAIIELKLSSNII